MGDFLQPGLIMIMTGIIIAFMPDRFEYARKILMIASPVLVFALLLDSEYISSQDRLQFIFAVAFAGAAVVCAIYNLGTKNRYEKASEAVYAGSAVCLLFVENWLTMVVFWELMAVASWLVVISSRTKKADKAGFRYLLVHFMGGNLLLTGIIIKMVSGSYQLELLTGQNDIAFWLILIGVAVNTAIPPFNGWLPDSYPESTSAGTVYLGTYTTKVGIFYIIKLFAGTEILVYFGVIMAIFGAVMALLENDIKRLFSYHIISQLGYMVAAASIGSQMGIDGASAHAFCNILYKGTLLMCVGAVVDATGKRKITQLSGIGKRMPVTSAAFMISSLAIAGFPPFNGFVGKALVMNAVTESGLYWAEFALMIASVGTFFSITLKVNYFVFWGSFSEMECSQTKTQKISINKKIAMITGAFSCVVTGVFPNIIFSLTPFSINAHPYTLDHMTQYIQLFAAAGIVFLMYISHLKPKEKITLDTDWFYRKPLALIINKISFGIEMSLFRAGKAAAKAISTGNKCLTNPELFVAKLLGVKETKERNCLEKDDVLYKPIGWLVALNFAIFIIISAFVLLRRYMF